MSDSRSQNSARIRHRLGPSVSLVPNIYWGFCRMGGANERVAAEVQHVDLGPTTREVSSRPRVKDCKVGPIARAYYPAYSCGNRAPQEIAAIVGEANRPGGPRRTARADGSSIWPRLTLHGSSQPMHTLVRPNSTHLFSMTTPPALIQIVATSRGIVLDVQATNVTTDSDASRVVAACRTDLTVWRSPTLPSKGRW
jgi:hypothetical protein